MGRHRKQRPSDHVRRWCDGRAVVVPTVVGAINAIPLLPKVMELVGLGYSAWFVYRYVLFKESRKELEQTVDDLLTKISDI